MSESSTLAPSHWPTLRPGVFPEIEEEETQTPKQSQASSHKPLDDDDKHWSLWKEIEPSKFQHLLHLLHKLSELNYVTWLMMMESNLKIVDLFDYCTRNELKPSMSEKQHYNYWWHANALVWSILTTNMTEEAICQVRHLFAGQTLTDWTLIITGMVTMKFNDGDSLPAYMACMKAYHHDLILMQHDINNQIFACFLQILMPPTWNYIFAGLHNYYTSAEVECHIKDEYRVWTNQNTAMLTYKAMMSSNLKQKSWTPIPGKPYCLNCKISAHDDKDCWSKGGWSSWQGTTTEGTIEKERQGEKRQGSNIVN
jgi:hypothetical protein